MNILNTLSRRFNFDFWINPRYLYDFVELIDLDDFDLIILENSEKGQYYVGRNLIPRLEKYNQFNVIYKNGDYILYTFSLIL